jgi:hypothetical protein
MYVLLCGLPLALLALSLPFHSFQLIIPSVDAGDHILFQIMNTKGKKPQEEKRKKKRKKTN